MVERVDKQPKSDKISTKPTQLDEPVNDIERVETQRGQASTPLLPHPNAILGLQATIGNQAVQRFLADAHQKQMPPDTVLALQSTIGNRAVQRLLEHHIQRNPDSSKRDKFPWIGSIKPWSTPLHNRPGKGHPHSSSNADVDIPRDTEVEVMGHKGGWLHVKVELEGQEREGYVSQELVEYKRRLFKLPPIEVKVDQIYTLREAFNILKQAETDKKTQKKFEPDKARQARIATATKTVEATKKYKVNRTTYQVSFDAKAAQKVQIVTIEDFVLFVETVERAYPSASPQEIASEIRQIWFSDVNWEVMVASQGITNKGKSGKDQFEDIETNDIAKQFDMKDLAPNQSENKKLIKTRLGTVDISHVLAGIDATLSGSPKKYPQKFLEARGHDDDKAKFAHGKLQKTSGGDVRDFATWAGDLGQAYAEYLLEHFLKKKKDTTLDAMIGKKASSAELLGDIHGYIAVQVSKLLPASASPTGKEFKISNVLRNLYMVDKEKTPASQSYQQYFETVSKQETPKLKQFIRERTMRFARNWYVKKAFDYKGKWGSKGWTKASIYKNHAAKFDEFHGKNESQPNKANKLSHLIDQFFATLNTKIK